MSYWKILLGLSLSDPTRSGWLPQAMVPPTVPLAFLGSGGCLCLGPMGRSLLVAGSGSSWKVVSLSQISPYLVFWSDVGWRAHLSGEVISGRWSPAVASLSINARELLVVVRGLLHFSLWSRGPQQWYTRTIPPQWPT